MTGRHRLRSFAVTVVLLAAVPPLSAVQARNADDVADQTALAVPRIGIPGARGVALPQPLTQADAALVRRALTAQHAGDVAEAVHTMERLENGLLRAAILADRYLDTAYIADAAELRAWLAQFGDQPDAPAIRALLDTSKLEGPKTAPTAEAAKTAPTAEAAKAASKVQAVPPRALLVQNNDPAAVEAARAILAGDRSAPRDSDALFSGGVAAWRLGETATARPLFEAAWRTADTPASRSAAAFWTARAARKLQDHAGYTFWLRRTAREPETFYGPIAQRALAPIVACLAPPPRPKAILSNADVDALLATPQGNRGFALLQVGERSRAEAEFRALWFDAGPRPVLAGALILVARAVGMSRFEQELHAQTAAEAAIGRLELPLLRPTGGFIMDPAFVYAVVRHESNFQPLAVSPVGARGLMQLMPATAAGMGGIGEGQPDRLNDPSMNLMLGQRYLAHLGTHPLVGDDLLRLIAAYGQGPSGMNRWAETVRDHGDPFVFIEAIPSGFMRQFVEDVLIYHWRYASALRLAASSLDALAAGSYPRFAPIRAIPGGMRARPDVCPATAVKG